LRCLLLTAPVSYLRPSYKPQHKITEALGSKSFDYCIIGLLSVGFQARFAQVITFHTANENIQIARFSKLSCKPSEFLTEVSEARVVDRRAEERKG
jgi:hypothetical protein